MTKLGIVGAMILAAAGAAGGGDVWAADIFPIEALSASAASNPKVCTGLWDFIATNCELSWQGITIYGTVDGGGGWQSHSAPLDSRSAPGASYLIEKINRSSRWSLAPNALSTSTIGIKGTEPVGGAFSAVFAVDAGFDPYSLRLSNGPGSLAANAGVPLNQQTADRDSSRAGQWYNGEGYVGVNSSTYGTLTVFRQYALSRDAAYDYDPLSGSYAFSPIKGETCGGGNTENCRHSTSLKYRIGLGHLRAAALWQFGGYAQNNASNGAYQFQIGADIPPSGKGALSLAAFYTYVRDAVSLALGPGSTDANGVPIPPFLPQALTATISDNYAVLLLAKYSIQRLKLYAGYERITYMAPSDPQTAFTDIAGSLVCENCTAINNIQHRQHSLWARRFWQQDFSGHVDRGEILADREARCDRGLLPLHPELVLRHARCGPPAVCRHGACAMRGHVQRDIRRCRLAVCTKVGSLRRPDVHERDGGTGKRLSPARQPRPHGWIALPLLKLSY